MGIAFWAVAGVTAAVCGTFATWLPYGASFGALLGVWAVVRRRPGSGRVLSLVLDWLPFPLVIVTYDMLHAVSPRSWGWTLDPWLRDADRLLLGADAAALLRPFSDPALTTVLAAGYAGYYVVPLAAGIWWYARGRRLAFRELMIAETGALFAGYLGYLFLPAQGPHLYLGRAELGPPLEGDFIGPLIRLRAEAHAGLTPRDAFPSLHTANAVSLLVVAWRHDRRAFAAVLVPMCGLLAATVYLRFHWVADVVAGAALAVAWQPAAAALARRESGR